MHDCVLLPFMIVIRWRSTANTTTSSHLQHCFEVRHIDQIHGAVIKAWKSEKNGEMIPGEHYHYRIQATSDEDRKEWMEKIRTSISMFTPGDGSRKASGNDTRGLANTI